MTRKKIYVDVREQDEFRKIQIPGSLNIPLSEIKKTKLYAPLLEDKDVVLVCRSGARAKMAQPEFESCGLACSLYPGGIQAWEREGREVHVQSVSGISIFRQVQIVVGFAVFVLAMLGYFLDSKFGFVAGIIGLALFSAGLFGFCLLATLLSKMPWNKVKP